MKKILFIINSLANGGAERALVNLVNNLPEDQFEITLFSLYSSGIYDKDIKENVKYKYLFKERKGFSQKLRLKILCKLISRKRLYKWVFKEIYDYEVAFLQGFPTELVRASSNKNSYKIAFVHSDFLNNYDVEKIYKTTQECFNVYKNFNRVCFVSESSRDAFEKVIGTLQNACIVHNVVDVNNICKQANEIAEQIYSNNSFRIITVSRLVKLKAIERVINAVEYINMQGINAECCIVGDGPERERLQQLIREKKLDDKIRMIGYCKNPYSYMSQADVYVCSSLTECYSTTAVESLILGIPLLTTEVSGMREIIANTDSGIVVENCNEALTRALYLLAKNPNRVEKMKKAAKQRAIDFSTKKQVEEFIKIL